MENPNVPVAPAVNPGGWADPLFEAVRAGLEWKNANEDEYNAMDVARDPAVPINSAGGESDPEIAERIRKAAERHLNK